jgi:hypothetical protein
LWCFDKVTDLQAEGGVRGGKAPSACSPFGVITAA